MPINYNDRNARYEIDFYIFQKVLLVTILLFMINITFYHYEKHRPKQKTLTDYYCKNGKHQYHESF